jgi:hypothetical protein
LIELRVRGRTAMQQIADWLEKLGMSEYAERFAENGREHLQAHRQRF